MRWTPFLFACAVLLSSACQQSQTGLDTGPIRLVNNFPSAAVAGSLAADSGYPATEWTFEEGVSGFTAGRGVEGVAAEAGTLSGKTTHPVWGIAVKVFLSVPEDEELHAVEIEARVSSGASLTVRLARG